MNSTVIENLKINASASKRFDRISVQFLDWSDKRSFLNVPEPDLILAADCVYAATRGFAKSRTVY